MNDKTRVYLAIAAGFRTVAQVKTATGLLVSQVRTCVTALTFDGSVQKLAAGYVPAVVQL